MYRILRSRVYRNYASSWPREHQSQAASNLEAAYDWCLRGHELVFTAIRHICDQYLVCRALYVPDVETLGAQKMHCTTLESPLNCLALNKDCSQVVVAGRNEVCKLQSRYIFGQLHVFKIFDIDDGEFVERVNLRVGRSLNLNYSIADVTWNSIDGHLLASAATNGAVVLWNLNKLSHSKQEEVFAEHRRSVNRVSFHYSESNWLMSGSQDGYMKLFDLRMRAVCSTFGGRPESVRDVQFDPHHDFMFAAAYENGNVQLWDIRNTSRWERQFTAHGGPVFSIDWHPNEKSWLASGGRDKIIKVWDVSGASKVRNPHSVQTIASVARVKWRPHRRYHIASCALLVDFSVSVWDVRRPYIPFAAFNEHKDVVTGIVWKPSDPHTYFSSSKDCSLYRHMFREASRPADHANPVGVDISITGNILHASSDRFAMSQNSVGNSSTGATQAHTRLPSFFRRLPDRSEKFSAVSSYLAEYTIDVEGLSMDWFVQSAKRYQLAGKPFEDLCDHNAKVATDLRRHQVAQTWQMVKLLYSTVPSTPVPIVKGGMTLFGSRQELANHKEVSDNDRVKSSSDWKHGADSKQHSQLDLDGAHDNLPPDASTGASDDESDIDFDHRGAGGGSNGLASSLMYIASGGGTSRSDFFFGDGDIDPNLLDGESFDGVSACQDWSLPTEAFQLRHELDADRPSSPDQPLGGHHQPNGGASGLAGGDSPPSTADESDASTTHQYHYGGKSAEATIRPEILCAQPFNAALPSLAGLVADTLRYHAQQGDVQLSVCVMIVIGERIRPHIDDTEELQWFTSYIDLLGRLQLWCEANEVIKLSRHEQIRQLSNQSTTVHTNCSRCGKQQLRSGWVCERCRGVVNLCSICHHPVKGLYVWCQGCTHGGHLAHVRDWLRQNKYCPAGCGHYCEYT